MSNLSLEAHMASHRRIHQRAGVAAKVLKGNVVLLVVDEVTDLAGSSSARGNGGS
jgi:hypothetical protein